MTRLEFLLIAILVGVVSTLAPAAVAAQDDAARVSGAGEATLPEGVAFYGVALSGMQLGQGILIAADGSAVGQFHAVLSGTSVLGLPQEVTVQGEVNAGTATGDGTVTFSGNATLSMGDGTVPVVGVPFSVTASTEGVQLVVDGATLPQASLTAGSVTIK
jgi:hypothetical protein